MVSEKIPNKTSYTELGGTILEPVRLTLTLIRKYPAFFASIIFIYIFKCFVDWSLEATFHGNVENYWFVSASLVFIYGLILASQFVSLNRWLQNRREDLDTEKKPISFLSWPIKLEHWKFILVFSLLYSIMIFLMNMRYDETFGGIFKIIYFCYWFFSFKIYMILPALALNKPLTHGWNLSENKYGQIFFSTVFVCIPFLLIALSLMVFSNLNMDKSASDTVFPMMFIVSLGSLIHYSVLYDYLISQKREGPA